VTIKKRPISADGSKIERRKSRRFPVSVPVEVSWRGKDGITVKEDAIARQVNAKGGFLKMAVYPELGGRVTLANFLSAQTAEARVIAAPNAREGVANGIVVELIAPSETFWGIDLQVEKTSVELQNLEKALQNEDIEPRLLKEYRDAVEYIRTAANTVRRLRECELRGLDEAELRSVVAAERIRRAVGLCLEVIADLDAGHVDHEFKGLDELYRTIEQLNSRLRRTFKAEAALKQELQRR
jgi:hypothetical protein